MTHCLRSLDAALWRLAGFQRSPWAGRLCRVICEGRGPGPHNVMVELDDGSRAVVIRRDKSLRLARGRDRQQEMF